MKYSYRGNGSNNRMIYIVLILQILILTIIMEVVLVVRAERAYPLGCSVNDPSYYEFDKYPFPPPGIPIKTTDDYMLVRRLGSGKFSDVFEATDVQLERKLQLNSNKNSNNNSVDGKSTINPEALVVLKCLKPVPERKIKRELLVLSHASHLPNLARVLALVVPEDYQPGNKKRYRLTSMPTLILEHAGVNSQWLCHPTGSKKGTEFLTEEEIKYYLYHLLVALDRLHSCGIMHRDVKPRNVLIDRTSKTLMLIDLGLADFYLPDTDYNVRVASRHYKSPELLLGYQRYDYGLDLWGVGCILAGLLFRREPFFRGKDNLDQLGTIIAVLGTADLHAYMSKYKIPMTPDIRKVIAKYTQQQGGSKKEWKSFIVTPSTTMTTTTSNNNNNNSSSSSSYPSPPSEEGLELLSKLLIYDHEQRLTAKQAMQHTFFDPVRDQVEKQIREKEITTKRSLTST